LNRPGNIRANAIAPGMIRTPRNEEFIAGPLGQAILERNPMQRAGEASDVGAAVCFLLSPAACYINGVVLAVDGGSLVTL
jgi:NAD(P)-dependent dehydrogenase (short-subunit alcohol dehydrogenase family)